MSSRSSSTSTAHSMVRLDIATGQPFEEFIDAFTAAVPPLDLSHLQEILETGGDWGDVSAAVEANAPHDFVVFSSVDGRALTRASGKQSGFVAYLMGNPLIAERMSRHAMNAMLYAPLRVLLRDADDGTAVFVIDQPSTVFAGLGIDEITAVGRELDAKVAHLLEQLGVVPPEELSG